jgi:hypothetical protein
MKLANGALAAMTLGLSLFALACGSSGPSSAKEFCEDNVARTCDKAFQCTPAELRGDAFTMAFGASPAACRTLMAGDCANATAACAKFNASAAQTCLDKVSALSCADSAALGPDTAPAECKAACQ